MQLALHFEESIHLAVIHLLGALIAGGIELADESARRLDPFPRRSAYALGRFKARLGSRCACSENHAALDLRLTEQDFADLDRAFPPPSGPTPLEVL